MDKLKFYLMWQANYGVIYTVENFFRINQIYNGLKNISEAFGVGNEFRMFLYRPIKKNLYIEMEYLWVFVEDFSVLRGRLYVFELRKIFNGGK